MLDGAWMTTKLKITAIKPYPVWVGTRNQMLVKVETDQGIFGWGESGLSGREKAVAGAVEHYREFSSAATRCRSAAIWQEIYRSQYFEGGRVLQAAISAIDIALHDIKGKALGVPVYELLGGKQRDRIPTFASTGARGRGRCCHRASAGELRAQRLAGDPLLPRRAKAAADIFEPRESIGATASGCIKAREALGDDVVLGIDYHHRLSVAEAASFCNKLAAACSDFLEEPIRDETPEAYESLRTMTDIPFAIGEEFASKVAVPALHRARHPPVQPHRRLQCRRPHRGDEGRRLERGALCRHDAAQSAGSGVHRRDRASRRGGAELRVARNAGARKSKLGFDNSDFFPVQPRLDGADYPVGDLPGLGRRGQ